MRYAVFCYEHGSTYLDPYDEDNSFEIAKDVCEVMAKTTRCRWYIYDNKKFECIFVCIGDRYGREDQGTDCVGTEE